MKRIIIFIAIGCIGLFFFIIPDLPMVEQLLQKQDWITHSARIDDATIDSIPHSASKTRFKVFINYSYTYNNTQYHGTDIQNNAMIEPTSSTTSAVRSYVAERYPRGRILQIILHPQFPNRSLVPEFHRLSMFSFLIGSFIVVLSMVMIGTEVWKMRRYRDS